MIENSLLYLTADGDYLNSRKPDMIETFVMLYGEDRREEITKKINSVNFIYYYNTETLKRNIQDVTASIFKETLGLDTNTFFGDNIDMLYNLLTKQDTKVTINKDKILKLIDPSLTSIQELLDGYNNGKYPKLHDFVSKYEELIPTLAPYREELKNNEESASQIKQKYFEQLYSEYEYMIPEELRNDKNKAYVTSKVFGAGLNMFVSNNGFAFDDNHERILNDPNEKDYKKSMIIRERIDYLKLRGINLNNGLNEATYEDYLNNPEALAIINEARIEFEKLSKRSSELYKQQVIDITESQPDYQRNRKRIDGFNLENKNDGFGVFDYNSDVSASHTSNFTKNEWNEYVLSPIIALSGSSDDFSLFHELNHRFEAEIISKEDNAFLVTTGWDTSTYYIEDKRELIYDVYEGTNRKYELISEYINDTFGILLTKLCHNSGKSILGNRNPYVAKYNVVSFLLKDFFLDFTNIIIKSRSNGNMSYIGEMLGQDNFDALNDLVNDFKDNIGIGFGSHSIVYKAMNNSNDVNAPYINSLIDRKNEILSKMKEHLKSVNYAM